MLKPKRSATAGVGAFTIVELLVVISIIGIMVGLLLPALRSAREAARRTQCQHNLKQVAIALQHYHETYGKFPPATTWDNPDDMDATRNRNFGPNWIVRILPQFDQQSIYDAFDLTKPIADPNNADVHAVQIENLLCPSDLNNQTLFAAEDFYNTRYLRGFWGRTNYAANAGTGMLSRASACGEIDGHGCSGREQNWRYYKTQGVMGPNVSTSYKDITDGSTHTMMVTEIRVGVNHRDIRGTWAMEGAGPSAVAAYGFYGDARGPNCNFGQCDDIVGCSGATKLLGESLNMRDVGMSCLDTTKATNRQACPRSVHPEGLYVAMCDASVQWLSNDIEVYTPVNVLSVWDRLILSADGLVIKESPFLQR